MQERVLRTGMALHARPLDRFVRRARAVAGRVRVRFGEKEADGRNVTELLLLAVPRGAEVRLSVESADEGEAVDALAVLLEQREEPAAAPAPPEAAAGASLATAPLVGVPGAPGRGVGRAHRPDRTAPDRPAGAPDEERRRLERALEAARAATRRLFRPEDPFSDIFGAQLTLLDDPALGEALRGGLTSGRSAERCVRSVFAGLAARFRALGSSFAADRHADVADVRERLLAALGLEEVPVAGGECVVVILEEATPSRLALLEIDRVAGVISEQGGPTSHAAVVARGRGIPLVFASAAVVAGIAEGELLLIDGTRGVVERAPESAAPMAALAPAALPPAAQGAVTRDQVRVVLRANLGAPGDLTLALEAGAEGSGLLRSELLFAGRDHAPSLEEQAEAYARIGRAMAPHPVVVRLFDAGSDKPLAFLPGPEREPNPALGRRGVRLLLDHPRVLADQLQAIAKARLESGCDLRAMVPMVSDAAELGLVRDLCPPGLPLGSMVETPAAALLAGRLARSAAFLSVGSNDLAQYVMAHDRQRGGAGLHPAVLRLLAEVVREADQAGVECSLCGELAGDPRTAPLLVGLGYRSLSVAPAQLRVVRESLSAHTLPELRERAGRALGQPDGASLAACLDTWGDDA